MARSPSRHSRFRRVKTVLSGGWVFAEFDKISERCGGCLEISYMSEMYGPRRGIPDSMNVVSVIAIQRGLTDPNRMVVMSGDIDAIRSGGRGWGDTDSVPGANDNASGMAGTIEAARVLTQHTFKSSSRYEDVGKMFFGLPPSFWVLDL